MFRSLLVYACVLESFVGGECVVESRDLLDELEFDIEVRRLMASELRREAQTARRPVADPDQIS